MKQSTLMNPARSLATLADFAAHDQLESVDTYRTTLEAVTALLAEQGGLLHLSDLPTLVLPDLHARRSFLVAVLAMRIIDGPLAGQQVFDLLQQGLINIICVGDIVHSEERSYWVVNLDGEWTPDLLDKEMVRSLGAGLMIMYLKLQFPEHFYCLRGNHDDMIAEMGPFRKFVGVRRDEEGELVMVDGSHVLTGEKGESTIVREWVLNRKGWGQDFVDAWSHFEQALPLFASGSYYTISHTLPFVPISEADLRNPQRSKDVVYELTSNRGIKEAAIRGTLQNLGLQDSVQRWFYGHTPVSLKKNEGKYEEDLDGFLVRLNSPVRLVYAYVPPSHAERRFNPAIDVFYKTVSEDLFHL